MDALSFSICRGSCTCLCEEDRSATLDRALLVYAGLEKGRKDKYAPILVLVVRVAVRIRDPVHKILVCEHNRPPSGMQRQENAEETSGCGRRRTWSAGPLLARLRLRKVPYAHVTSSEGIVAGPGVRGEWCRSTTDFATKTRLDPPLHTSHAPWLVHGRVAAVFHSY